MGLIQNRNFEPLASSTFAMLGIWVEYWVLLAIFFLFKVVFTYKAPWSAGFFILLNARMWNVRTSGTIVMVRHRFYIHHSKLISCTGVELADALDTSSATLIIVTAFHGRFCTSRMLKSYCKWSTRTTITLSDCAVEMRYIKANSLNHRKHAALPPFCKPSCYVTRTFYRKHRSTTTSIIAVPVCNL